MLISKPLMTSPNGYLSPRSTRSMTSQMDILDLLKLILLTSQLGILQAIIDLSGLTYGKIREEKTTKETERNETKWNLKWNETNRRRR